MEHSIESMLGATGYTKPTPQVNEGDELHDIGKSTSQRLSQSKCIDRYDYVESPINSLFSENDRITNYHIEKPYMRTSTPYTVINETSNIKATQVDDTGYNTRRSSPRIGIESQQVRFRAASVDSDSDISTELKQKFKHDIKSESSHNLDARPVTLEATRYEQKIRTGNVNTCRNKTFSRVNEHELEMPQSGKSNSKNFQLSHGTLTSRQDHEYQTRSDIENRQNFQNIGYREHDFQAPIRDYDIHMAHPSRIPRHYSAPIVRDPQQCFDQNHLYANNPQYRQGYEFYQEPEPYYEIPRSRHNVPNPYTGLPYQSQMIPPYLMTPQVQMNRVVPMRKEKEPDTFDGSKTEWVDYIVHFEQVAAWNRWTDVEKAQ